MIKDISILIGGAAGNGIQTIGTLLAKVCHKAGLFIFSADDFESRIRGGHNFHLLRVSNQPLSAPRMIPDVLVAINDETYTIHKDQLPHDGIALVNKDESDESRKRDTESNVFNIPLDRLARDAGGKIASNTVAAGAVIAIIGAKFECLEQVLVPLFEGKGQAVLALNILAAQKGYEVGKQIDFKQKFDFDTVSHSNIVMSGAKAAALGALAADCRFFPFYPMSPGTPVISNTVSLSKDLPVVIEQAEDEIAAVNMAIGASFAGVRAMTSTSGGGFCLMVEGLGLAGMAEIPIVIINAQRPGPATGLATRTAQADLLFAINASHDDFPRFVFAPGSVLETFKSVKKAFWLADKFQVPSIVLMDQYLMDSARTEPNEFDLGIEHEKFYNVETQVSQDEKCFRYKLTQNGISPRKIPCQSEDLVRSTGNEHTQEGLSTEDPDIRVSMVDKRMKKLELMKNEMRLPSLFCDDSSFFLTGWGSSKGSIMEACLHLREKGINAGWIIFEDIWPLDARKLTMLLKNKKLIMVEGNATCQLGNLIRQLTGVEYHSSILKYDGRPIYPDYIVHKVNQIIGL